MNRCSTCSIHVQKRANLTNQPSLNSCSTYSIHDLFAKGNKTNPTNEINCPLTETVRKGTKTQVPLAQCNHNKDRQAPTVVATSVEQDQEKTCWLRSHVRKLSSVMRSQANKHPRSTKTRTPTRGTMCTFSKTTALP